MPSTDREKTSILTLRACIWLEGDVWKARDFAQPCFQVVDHLEVAGVLFGGGVWVWVSHGRPA